MQKIGICTWFSYNEIPIAERLQLIKDAKFDATCLWWDYEDRQQQPEMARKIGLHIDNVHAPFRDVKASSIWEDGVDGDDYQNQLITCVNDCAVHEIPTVVIHLTSTPPYPPVTDLGLRRISKIVAVAEQKNVKLAFENLWSPAHLDAVMRNFVSPNVGLCYDSGHENLNRPSDVLAAYGDRLFAVHINDNFNDTYLPDGSINWSSDAHVLPFDGTIDWGEKMRKLQICKSVDCFTLEVDFNRNHERAAIYHGLPAQQYLALAYERAAKLLKL